MAEPLALCYGEDIQQPRLWQPSGYPTQLGVWLCFTHPNTALILQLASFKRSFCPATKAMSGRPLGAYNMETGIEPL